MIESFFHQTNGTSVTVYRELRNTHKEGPLAPPSLLVEYFVVIFHQRIAFYFQTTHDDVIVPDSTILIWFRFNWNGTCPP